MDSLAPMQRLQARWTSFYNGEDVVWPATLAGVVVAVLSWVVGSHRGDIQVDVALVSMAAFLFGVLLAFTIVRMRERLASIQELVAKGNAGLLLDLPAGRRSSIPPTVTASGA